MTDRIPLVIDTDTAADDCFALMIGLTDPRADLRAITMVAGNVGFEQQVENAFLTLEVVGRRGEVPVHLGARQPLEREWASASDVHGDGVGGQKREGSEAASTEEAPAALVRLAREYAGELEVVAIGPLTNIALAVQSDPDFARNVAELVVMGGSINARGNITAAAEYNIYVDPEAAQIVLDAGFPSVRFVTWDPLSLRDVVFDQARIDSIRALGTRRSDFFVTANQKTFDFDVAVGVGGSIHCDSLSVLVALEPTLVREERGYFVAVELQGELTRGATVFDWRAVAPPVNATAIESVDRERFVEYMMRMLAEG
ncbi:nucleoside hydrolase [Microbacterium sp. P06]|uniref:nucleoside hydrolase n=1 Tax=Microbacterium sp. P06 TaxID=3366949 RepID=UPI0037476156